MIGVLIPSLNPDDRLITLVKELKNNKIDNIFIVNDGSSLEYDKYFKKCEDLGCILFKNKVNMGKGYSLKKGINNINKDYPNIKGIVTADSDGQHLVRDIIRVKEVLMKEDILVLGVRCFNNKSIPIRSKIGNRFSSLYLKLIRGISLEDTQTGLRGIPRKDFDYALNIKGDRFDYEMNFLLNLQEEYTTILIDTIYKKDHTSHFKTVIDSLRIYKSLGISFLIELSSYLIFFLLLRNNISFIISVIIFGIYNYTLYKYILSLDKRSSLVYLFFLGINLLINYFLLKVNLFFKVIFILIIFIIKFILIQRLLLNKKKLLYRS